MTLSVSRNFHTGMCSRPAMMMAAVRLPGRKRALTITQRPDSLIVEYVFFAPYDLQPPVRMAFAADGSESVNDVMLSHATTRLRSRIAMRGNALEISTLHTAPVGSHTEVIHRLSLESPTSLIVEATRRGVYPTAPNVTTTRYVKR